MIFQFALPPYFLLDSALYRGPESAWSQSLRLKKSLVLVCKAWWYAGVKLLYADIVLRRMGQLAALVCTLENPNNDLETVVGTIRATFFIPDAYVVLAQNTLNRLIDCCPRLISLAICPATEGPPLLHAHHGFRFDRLVFPTTITHMEWTKISWGDLISVLESCKELESLSFQQPHSALDGRRAYCDVALTLPHLKVFKCELPFNVRFSNTILIRWSLPRLERATFIYSNIRMLLADSESCRAFCERHGRGLRYFQLVADTPVLIVWKPYDLQPLLDACPVLEHLVLSSIVLTNVMDLIRAIKHPTLAWLDVWLMLHDFKGGRATMDNILNNALEAVPTLPNLRNIRVLDWELQFLTELPVHCHPRNFVVNSENGHDYERYQYPGMCILNTKHFVVRDDPNDILNFYNPLEMGGVESDSESIGDFDISDEALDDDTSSGEDSSDEDEDFPVPVDQEEGANLLKEQDDLYKDAWGMLPWTGLLVTETPMAQQELQEPNFDAVLALRG